MILVIILVASVSYCYGAGVPHNPIHRPGYPAFRPGFPVHRPGYPAHRPGFPINRPGYPAHRPGFPAHRPGLPVHGPGSSLLGSGFGGPPAAHESRPISDEDNFLAAKIGVRLPPNECIISYNKFLDDVVDKDWISPYAIDNDFLVNPGVSYKPNIQWTTVNSTFIRRKASVWDSAQKLCVYFDDEFRPIGEEKAIFRPNRQYKNRISREYAKNDRVDYIVSFDPSTYVIFYVCHDARNSYEGRCPNSEIFLLVKDQRDTPIEEDGVRRGGIVLNDLHWILIEETFKNCLGQQFVDDTDPQIKWVWEKEDCAKPESSQFEERFNG